MTALPAGRVPILATMRLHSCRMEGPPARWMAPSTPPPPRREELAALTMASVVSLVMSAGPWSSSVLPFEKVSRAAKSGMAVERLIICHVTGGGRVTRRDSQRDASATGLQQYLHYLPIFFATNST